MLGDVWLCSGQSNMEYPLRRALNGDGEVQAAGDPDLRLMKVHTQLANDPQASFATPPSWRQSTPDSARDFPPDAPSWNATSARPQKVPIGAIDEHPGWDADPRWTSEASDRASWQR